LDRIDKVLLILPFLPVADLLSTLFSLSLGGQEVGILARPILEHYGSTGLVFLAILASAVFLVFMEVVIYIKKLFINEFRFKWMWYVLAVPIFWFFVLEGVYVSTVAMNVLAPLAPSFAQTFTLRVIITGAYFLFVNALTLPHMKQLQRF
jgi:Ni,Fe-hydrogenase I cytochrome b subunit